MGLLDALMQGQTQQPQGPPSDLLQQLMSLGSVDQRHRLLQDQMGRANELSQGAPVDYAHGKGTPLLLSGLANLISAGVGGYQAGKTTGGLRDLITQTDATRTAGAREAMNSPMPDMSSLLTASPEQMPSALQGVKDMIQKQRNTGMALSMSGDQNLAPMGKSLYGDSDKAQQSMMGMPQARNELQMSGLDIAKKVRGAAVETSPVVGGVRALFLKKMGYPVPSGASPEELAALVPEAEKVASVPKYAALAPGSGVLDVHSGKVSGGGGAAGGGMLSPEALDREADKYNKTGALPSFGRANPVVHGAIIRRAAELSGAPLADTQANFKGDSASLKKMQMQADAMESFENTALKNLDQFIGTAHSVVDTGSPLFNAPARVFMKQVAGDPKMSQFAAARDVAVQEISKVLGGSLGGAAVSDSARHEASGLISPDMSIAQIEAVANILKQDMANRKAAVQGQLGTIRGRMSGQPATAEAGPAKATHRFNPATGKIEAVP